MKKKLLIIGLVLMLITVAYGAKYFYDSVYIIPNVDQVKTFVVQDADGVEVFSVNTSTAGVVVTGTQSVSGVSTLAGNLVTNGVLEINSTVTAGTGFWDDAPSIASNDMSVAFFYTEDFIGTVLDSAGEVRAAGVAHKLQTSANATLESWKHFGTSGWTMTQPAGTLGGQLVLTTLTGSDNEFSMTLGELGTETFVEFTESSEEEVWLEIRMSEADTTAAASFFIGFSEEGAAVTDVIVDAGNEVADLDFVGFISYEGAPNLVEAFYQTSGGVNIDTFGTALNLSESLITYGIHFDGDSTITWYMDGSSIGSVEQDIAYFPDTEELTILIAVKEGAGDKVLTFDWIKLVSER